tara:strand:- start:47 stop:217 length:171 start_codon:yes stop_codon:yes gene_type:complete
MPLQLLRVNSKPNSEGEVEEREEVVENVEGKIEILIGKRELFRFVEYPKLSREVKK